MKYFVIANFDNTSFIGIDENSGGYLYETNYLFKALIGSYKYVKSYYDDLDRMNIDSTKYCIKEIFLSTASEVK